jgi:hypothetical protein
VAEHDRWMFDLALRDGTRLGPLEVQDASMTWRMMAAGEATITCQADAVGAGLLEVHSVILRAWRQPYAGGSRVLRFAGEIHEPLTDAGDADGNEQVTFTARDPYAALAQRVMWTNFSHGPDTLDDVVVAFIGELGIVEDDPAGPDTFVTTGLGAQAVGGGWPSGVTGSWTRRQPGEDAFREMWEQPAGTGFYWWVVPVDPPTSSVWAAVQISMDMGPLRDVHLEYGPGTRANLSAYALEQRRPITQAFVTGANGLQWLTVDEAAAADYGVWGVSPNYPDVTSLAQLEDLAAAQIRPTPEDTARVTLAWPNPAGSGLGDTGLPPVPMLWEDFDLNDRVHLYVRGRRRTFFGYGHVRGATVKVDDSGVERLTDLVLDATPW